jgi:hypothetical protein
MKEKKFASRTLLKRLSQKKISRIRDGQICGFIPDGGPLSLHKNAQLHTRTATIRMSAPSSSDRSQQPLAAAAFRKVIKDAIKLKKGDSRPSCLTCRKHHIRCRGFPCGPCMYRAKTLKEKLHLISTQVSTPALELQKQACEAKLAALCCECPEAEEDDEKCISMAEWFDRTHPDGFTYVPTLENRKRKSSDGSSSGDDDEGEILIIDDDDSSTDEGEQQIQRKKKKKKRDTSSSVANTPATTTTPSPLTPTTQQQHRPTIAQTSPIPVASSTATAPASAFRQVLVPARGTPSTVQPVPQLFKHTMKPVFVAIQQQQQQPQPQSVQQLNHRAPTAVPQQHHHQPAQVDAYATLLRQISDTWPNRPMPPPMQTLNKIPLHYVVTHAPMTVPPIRATDGSSVITAANMDPDFMLAMAYNYLLYISLHDRHALFAVLSNIETVHMGVYAAQSARVLSTASSVFTNEIGALRAENATLKAAAAASRSNVDLEALRAEAQRVTEERDALRRELERVHRERHEQDDRIRNAMFFLGSQQQQRQ